MKMFNQAVCVALTAGLGMGIASGCGGDSSGGPADTGLPPTQLLSDVTPDEAEQACERVETSFKQQFNENTLIEAICTMYAAASTTTPSSCSSFRDGCIEEAMQPGSEAMTELNLDEIEFGCDMAEVGECGDATVGDLETCMGDTFNLMDSALHRFDCNDAGTVEMDDLNALDFEPPQSCEVVTCGENAGPFG